ncbi:hypothetical protein K431DRAFT_287921 [Polychaeton citri CBS 116435]|uniref:Uncharacterized protein n=1 Tax=Polychaeton citri CBS 116435 TaxID=1314669 RepID=A0A9P4Q088_9PEZI|nr:hypothetical protein K431DRAFT_287921 [Polychaeton citri CBS 116435]
MSPISSSKILSVALLAALTATSTPLPQAGSSSDGIETTHLAPFYLVTTTQSTSSSNSSLLANVSATSLFDPYYQTNYLLRLIDPGYLSLPTFNLTSGTLHTAASGPHNIGPEQQYNSTFVEAGSELQFAPSVQTKGNVGLWEGYLVTVGGSCEGWTICDGELGQVVIEWEGVDASCHKTFLQAVGTPPY